MTPEARKIAEMIDALPDHIAARLCDVLTFYMSLDEEQQGIFESCVFPFLDLDRDPLEVQMATTPSAPPA